VIEGDTARVEVWAGLDGVLARDWPHTAGHTLPVRVMCVDAGYAAQDVYAWVRHHPQASLGFELVHSKLTGSPAATTRSGPVIAGRSFRSSAGDQVRASEGRRRTGGG
jgi:phage terminase large subunit GpA-like protein